MNCETYIKERHHLKAMHKLNKLTKEEQESAQRDLRHLINVLFSTLYLHGHPPLENSSNMTLLPIETHSN